MALLGSCPTLPPAVRLPRQPEKLKDKPALMFG
jgi:hypothetical protein